MNRRKLIAYAAMIALALAAVSIPIARRTAVATLIEFANITEKIARFPCWLLDYSRSPSLDRLDPTCPQCTQPFD
jgi:hypothetical protein